MLTDALVNLYCKEYFSSLHKYVQRHLLQVNSTLYQAQVHVNVKTCRAKNMINGIYTDNHDKLLDKNSNKCRMFRPQMAVAFIAARKEIQADPAHMVSTRTLDVVAPFPFLNYEPTTWTLLHIIFSHTPLQ